MNKFKMQNLNTSCFYAQKNFKKARCRGSCGSDVLKRLLLAIERERNKEMHPGPIFGQHNVSMILF